MIRSSYAFSSNWIFSKVLLLLLTSAVLGTSALAQQTTAQGQSAAAEHAARIEAAEAQTLRLAELAERLLQVPGHARAPLVAEIQAAAEARRALIAGLIEDSPGEVLRLGLPARLQGHMPPEVQDLIEERLEFEGELEVLYVDHEDPAQSRLAHTLKTELGERITLHFADKTPSFPSGSQVIARGLFFAGLETGENAGGAGAVVLGADDGGLELLECCDGSGGSSTAAAPTPNTFGEQRTAVLLVNFEDDPGNQPWSVQDAQDLVFGQVSDFYFENSYEQAWLAGDVFGWYTMALPSTTCSTTAIQAEADAAALAQGVDPETYDRVIYIYPDYDCFYAGKATYGGSPSRAFIAGSFTLRTIGHELGHNFFLNHSHGMNCTGEVVGSSCPWIEYGDTLDIMGTQAGHLNSFQKQWLGWLDYGASPAITTVETDGTYQIAPYELSSGAPLALRIARDPDPTTGQQRWFYLEYRQPIGFDGPIENSYVLDSNNILNGVVFHLGTEGDQSSSFLLDMTPDSSPTGTFADLYDPALEVGVSYTDPAVGVTITTESTDVSGATISVAFSGPACVHANPSITVTPAESQWVAPGTPFAYSVTVTNRDNDVCANAGFDLIAGVPSGWTGTFADPVLSLAPGASRSTTLTVTSPVSAADGFYDVTSTAENNTDPAFAGTATATYVVESTVANAPPQAEDDSTSTDANSAAEVFVLVNDFDPDGDPLIVTGVTQASKGVVSFTPEGMVVYTPNPKANGNDSFTYTVSDGMSSAVANVAVSVKKDNPGKGKGKP